MNASRDQLLRPPPPLVAGDRLTAEEFMRRYEAMPEVKKAELIEGVVYMGSPVSREHGSPHSWMTTWLTIYEAFTPGVRAFTDGTVELDLGENRPQPDVVLIVLPENGGRTSGQKRTYLAGSPELVAEVALSSAS